VMPRMIYQNAPHQLGRNGEKMGAILPLHSIVIHQAHPGFIDNGRCLEAVAGPLASQVATRQPVELVINNRGQPIECALISIAPGAEEPAYILHSRFTSFLRQLSSATATPRSLHHPWAGLYRYAAPANCDRVCMILLPHVPRLVQIDALNTSCNWTCIAD
jgi:hypothetical protein